MMMMIGMESLDKFNNDPEVFVFLISTLVGGSKCPTILLAPPLRLTPPLCSAGLNMTSANKVVIFGE